jgi:hypothetical protein
MKKKEINKVELMFLEDEFGYVTHLAIFVPIKEIDKIKTFIAEKTSLEMQ